MSNNIFDGLPFSPLMLATLIEESYNDLLSVTEQLQKAQSDAQDRRSENAAERRRILFNYKDNMKELGSNDATREATIAEKTMYSMAEVAQAEDVLRTKQQALELARITVESYRAQLRILEVVATVSTDRTEKDTRP